MRERLANCKLRAVLQRAMRIQRWRRMQSVWTAWIQQRTMQVATWAAITAAADKAACEQRPQPEEQAPARLAAPEPMEPQVAVQGDWGSMQGRRGRESSRSSALSRIALPPPSRTSGRRWWQI